MLLPIALLWVGCTALNPSFGDGASAGESDSSSVATTTSASGPGTDDAGTISTSATSTATASTTSITGNEASSGDSASSASSGSDTGRGTDTDEEARPGVPCPPPGADDSLVACYDFENVTDRVPDVSGGMHDLKAFVGEVSDGPAGWEHGVVCEPGSCFAGPANIDLGNVGFTLEVWARLTRTKLELDEHGDLFTIIAAGGEGMGVRAGRAGSEAPSLYAHFLGTRQQLFGGRADTEYRCIAVTWAGDGSAMVRLVGSDGSTDDTEIQEGAAGPDLTDALLQLGDAEGLVPAEVIGVRVWNRPVAQPCTNPGVPR